MIYLAGPYSDPSAIIRLERFEALTKKASELMLAGHVVYSPITHGHVIAARHDLPLESEWWIDQSLGMLRHATKMMVLNIPGRVESKGVKIELAFAQKMSIDVELVEL